MNTIQITKQQHNLLSTSLSKDPYREQFHYIYADDTNIVATDACRMVILTKTETLNPPPGFYLPLKANNNFYLTATEPEITFPNYQNVTPEYTDSHLKGEFYLPKNKQAQNLELCKIILKTGCIINLDYFKPLHTIHFKLYSDSINSPLVAKFEGGQYIIMPIAQEQNQ